MKKKYTYQYSVSLRFEKEVEVDADVTAGLDWSGLTDYIADRVGDQTWDGGDPEAHPDCRGWDIAWHGIKD